MLLVGNNAMMCPSLRCLVADIATGVGYLVVSRPFLDLSHPRHLHTSQSELMEA